ncbi:MAG TPA: hypothetical protein VM452_05655, partial [Caulifigura sp.]|nr:hypothetical protein [Caulifigura sp.]
MLDHAALRPVSVEPPEGGTPAIGAWWIRFPRLVGRVLRDCFGLASVIVLLAVLAAVPVLNFAALGYLLAAEGRIARGGRVREGIPLLEIAPRLGSIALGFWLWTLPLRFIGGA